MSVEKLTRRSVRRLFYWRLLGDLVSLPRMLFATVATWLGQIEATVYTRELDAARAYRALTGVDLGLASGQPNRYSGIRAGAADHRDRLFDEHAGQEQ